MKNLPETPDLREQIAALAHEQWAGWMRYLFSRCEKLQSGPYTGGLVMPREWVDRWHRQVETPYAALSEAEKNSDREEADRVLALAAPPSRAPQELEAEAQRLREEPAGWQDSIKEMQWASDLVDEANSYSEYQPRLIALAVIAREFLRRLPAPPSAPSALE